MYLEAVTFEEKAVTFEEKAVTFDNKAVFLDNMLSVDIDVVDGKKKMMKLYTIM